MTDTATSTKLLRALAGAGLMLAARLAWRLALPSWRAAASAQNRGRSIIQHASEAIISTDGQQRILLANPAAAAMFGTTVEAMQGAPLSDFLPRDQRMPADGAAAGYFGATGIRLGVTGRRAADYAVTGLKADGQYFSLEGSISAASEDGRRIYTVILRDITERKQIQEQLQQSYSQLRELSAALQTIREEERTHISRELHDDLGQLLATLRVDLTLLQQQPGASPATQRLLHSMDGLLLAAITSLRRIAGNLRPRALDEGGLYFALESLRQDFADRHGIACALLADEEELELSEAYSTAIYRIVQEALTNIARHAGARHVSLRLRRGQEGLLLEIQDDGHGIAEQDMNKAASFGLIGMRERVWALHGDIAIASDSGTLITISLPLPAQPGA
jgi:PAS domain S-box-containing protein